MYPTYQVGIHKRMNFYDVEKLEKKKKKKTTSHKTVRNATTFFHLYQKHPPCKKK